MSEKNQTKWDQRFVTMAALVASFSKDPSTKCGAVIVRPDHSVAAIGYNGFPRDVPDVSTQLLDRSQKYPRTIHAEMNAILSTHESLKDCTIYTYPMLPCDRCASHIVQAGIKKIVTVVAPHDLENRWGANMKIAQEIFSSAGAEVRIFKNHNIPGELHSIASDIEFEATLGDAVQSVNVPGIGTVKFFHIRLDEPSNPTEAHDQNSEGPLKAFAEMKIEVIRDDVADLTIAGQKHRALGTYQAAHFLGNNTSMKDITALSETGKGPDYVIVNGTRWYFLDSLERYKATLANPPCQ